MFTIFKFRKANVAALAAIAAHALLVALATTGIA